MAPSISQFPPEIINLIFDSLSTPEFHSLCRVNRYLRTLSEPRLYSDLRWTWKFDWPEAPPRPYPMTTRLPPFVPFLHTILRRPELAASVETVELVSGDFGRPTKYGHYKDAPELPVVGADLSKLVSIVEGYNVPYGDIWIEELRSGKTPAFVALLLTLTPNLKHLRIDEEYLPETVHAGCSLESACDALRSAYGETSSSTNALAGSFPCDQTHLMYFLYLPAAKRLASAARNSPRLSWPSPGNQARLANLQSMHITIHNTEHLGRILCAAKNLKRLHWRWPAEAEYNDMLDFGTVYLDLDTVIAALSPVRHCLADLTISIGHKDLLFEKHYDGAGTRGSLTDLAAFLHLESLEVPFIFLTRAFTPDEVVHPIEQCLPPNLESLIISDTVSFGEEWTYQEAPKGFEVLALWLDRREISTPRLSRLGLVLEDTADVRYWGTELSCSTPSLSKGHMLLDSMDRIGWGPTSEDHEMEHWSARFGLQLKVFKKGD
ncbi:hypothetical protein PG990_013572 [Apiospora arundinis]